MWFEWLVRRFDMGALVDDSLQQQQPTGGQPGVDQMTSTTYDASNLNCRKAARRVPTPHFFPPTPSPTLLPGEIVSPPLCMVWSPLFENSPCKDMGYHSPGGLKVLSSNLFGDQIEAPPSGGWTPEQQSFNHLAREYLQTTQELKSCTLMSNHGHETPTTSGPDKPPYAPPGYKELRAGFWKRLVETGMCHKEDNKNLNSPETENSTRKSNILIHAGQKNDILEDDMDKRLSATEIEVVLSEKQNGEKQVQLETSLSTTNGVSNCVAETTQDGVTCIPHLEHPSRRNNIAFMGDNQEANICRTGASSRETSEGDAMNVVAIAVGSTRCEKREDSVCSLGGRGIGRGRIAEDGIPMTIATFSKPWGEERAPFGSLGCNKKEDEGDMIWDKANWCVVDSCITGHGKETTWTVQGFEEDDGIVKEDLSNSEQCQRPNQLLLAHDASSHDGSVITCDPVVETCHGPLPKWTQQALQERVAKNLKESEGMPKVGHTINNLHQNMDREEIESDNRERAQCQTTMLNELLSIGNSLHCRMGGKVFEEAVLSETRDKAGGGGTKDLVANIGNPSCIHESWRKMHRSLNSIVGPSTMKSDGDLKDLSNMASLRECRRRKRGSTKKRGESPSMAMASCVKSMNGDAVVEVVQQTQQDATTLAFKLAKIHARDAKMLRANASSMHNHVDALHLEVQNRVHETRKAHEAYFREKLRVILKLTSTLFALAHDEAQEVEGKGHIVVV